MSCLVERVSYSVLGGLGELRRLGRLECHLDLTLLLASLNIDTAVQEARRRERMLVAKVVAGEKIKTKVRESKNLRIRTARAKRGHPHCHA